MTKEMLELPDSKWDELLEKGVLHESDSKGADDWVKAYPARATDLKYSIRMYSRKLDVLRHRTFTEFYGGGIVD